MEIENSQEFRGNLQKKVNEIIKNKIISINLEKAIFNYTIQESKKEKL